MAVCENVKCVVVGDGTVGKTCMLISFTQNSFAEDYNATVFDNYIQNIISGGKTVRLCLWDTSGQEEFERMRAMSYHQANVFLVCAAVDNPTSFQNLRSKWIPELKKNYEASGSPLPPILIVGTKGDRRQEPGTMCVPRGEIDAVVNAITADLGATAVGGCGGYLECSAKDHTNIKDVFTHATKLGQANIKAARDGAMNAKVSAAESVNQNSNQNSATAPAATSAGASSNHLAPPQQQQPPPNHMVGGPGPALAPPSAATTAPMPAPQPRNNKKTDGGKCCIIS
eukprot:PhM_4_TR8049/c0_g1_i1/m.106645/K04392/RAC1; Ras-related C3 botulinum toxin substrate 1